MVAISLLLSSLIWAAFGWQELSPTFFMWIIASLIGGLWLLYPKYAFYACFFFVPLSVELELDFGLTTDLPGEPLLWILLLATVFRVLRYGLPVKSLHWLIGLIALHLAWVLVSSLFSSVPIISWKYFLSKCWFVIPMVLFPFYLTKEHFRLRWVAKSFVSGCFLAGLYYLLKLYQTGFSFDARVLAGAPIWRNHVNYVCTLLLALPFVIYLYKTTQKGHLIYRILFVAGMVMIYFAYARVAYLSLGIWLTMVMILRLKRVATVILLVVITAVGGFVYLSHDHHYLELAPDYSQAITQHKFEDLVTATVEKRDISSMERLYRWVAGAQMTVKRPLVGWGPGSFYSQYKPFALNSFKTYVSDNPDKSGVHSYLLMILVEQGIVGLFIWVAIISCALVFAQKLYFAAAEDQLRRAEIILAYSIIVLTISFNSINDMIEVIKMGLIFWFALTILVRQGVGYD